MSGELATWKGTVGDILKSLWAQMLHSDGRPINISGDTITFQMTLIQDSTEKVVAGSESGTVNNKQSGSGIHTITGITAAFPPVVTTSAAHGLSTGDKCFVRRVVGMTELNDREFTVTNVSSTTFSLQDEDATQYTAYGSGGAVETMGLVSYNWAAADVDTAGVYWGQFIRTSSGNTEHVPIGNRLRIEFVDPSKDA